MRIHTVLPEADLYPCLPRFTGFLRLRSGRRTGGGPRAYEISLWGTSPFRSQVDRESAAATRDEWGIFLSRIFERDPVARVGSSKNPEYADRADFRWQTCHRYDTLHERDQHPVHRMHRWDWVNDPAYEMFSCKCGAARRWLINGWTWQRYVTSPEVWPSGLSPLLEPDRAEARV